MIHSSRPSRDPLASSVDHFLNRDTSSYYMDWSHGSHPGGGDTGDTVQASMKIYVTCEDDTNDHDDLDDNLENLCLAVTEQALS